MRGAIGIVGGDCLLLNGFMRGNNNNLLLFLLTAAAASFAFLGVFDWWCEVDDNDGNDWADIVVVSTIPKMEDEDNEDEGEVERIGLATTTTFRLVRIKIIAAAAAVAAVEDLVRFIFFFFSFLSFFSHLIPLNWKFEGTVWSGLDEILVSCVCVCVWSCVLSLLQSGKYIFVSMRVCVTCTLFRVFCWEGEWEGEGGQQDGGWSPPF